MASKKYPWEERKKEFFENPRETLVDFITRKTEGKGVYTDRKGKRRLQRPFSDKTQGWVRERKEYREKTLADPTYFREKFMTEERKKKWADALDRALEFYPNMLLAYMMRVKKKVDSGSGPHIDELIKFGKMIQEYSGVKILTTDEVNQTNNIEIKIDWKDIEKDIQTALQNIENEGQEEENQ